MEEPVKKPTYYCESYGWCVDHEGWWFSVKKNDEEITQIQGPPPCSMAILGRECFAIQALLEYAQIITKMNHTCENAVALWPITLVQTAEKIDLLSSTLANFLGKEQKVMESSHIKQWTVGELPGTDEHTCDWMNGRAYMYDHAGGKLTLCVGLTSSSRAKNEGDSQQTFSSIQASYGQDIKPSLHRNWQCSWALFQLDFCNALKQYEPKDLKDLKEASANLLKQHERDFARLFTEAADYENKEIQKTQNRPKFPHKWRIKKSDLLDRINELEMLLSVQVEEDKQQKSKLVEADKEIRNLRNELSQYRTTLGSLSSGLNSVNLGEDATLPPIHEVLSTHDKLVSIVERLYDDIMENTDTRLQLMFAVNLSAVLHKMWETAYHRYTGLVKDLCGCDDLAKLTIASINEGHMHCRKHWKNLFMPLVDVYKADGEDSGAQDAQYPMGPEERPVAGHNPNHTNEDFSGPMEWFLNKNNKAEGAFQLLWKVVVCLFLQRPVCAFQFMKSVTVEFQSEIYQTIDGHTPQNGEQMIVLLPPIRVCPESILATEIGEEGCDASNWTILTKGIVDFQDTQ